MTGCGGGGGGGSEGEAALSTATGGAAGTPTASGTLLAPTTAAASAPGAGEKLMRPMAGGAAVYPFGSRRQPYVAGILPSHSTWSMDSALTAQYNAWKAARVVPVNWIAAGGYAVQVNDWNCLTVSESMGYGMLLSVVFAGHDPQAQTLFDGLLAVVRARPAWAVTPHDANGQHLMEWRLDSGGNSQGGGWSALDGDLDIALALLMADKQWGSWGRWNYLQEARNTINAIKSWCMKSDGTTKGLPDANNNRTSDYMVGHFRAFKAATGDGLWDRAIDRAYWITDKLQTQHSPGVGLMPDFVMGTHTGSPYPSTGYIGDGNDKEGFYWWNACRNPWRFASDYVLSGDWRINQVTGRMIDFFKNSSGGDPFRIGTGYTLWGTMLTGGNSGAYHGPICAGACVDARFQSFLDAMWKWNVEHLTTGYYDSEIQLLSLVVASGNWWTPGSVGSAPATQQPQQPAPQQPAPGTGGQGNLLVNGDFASGMANWNDWGNTWVAGGTLQIASWAAGGAGQDIGGKLAAGTAYQLTGSANITTSAEGVYIGVKLMDSWGNVLLDKQQVISSVTPAGVSVAFTAPASATSGYVYVWKNANAAVGVVDNLVLTAAGAGAPAPSSPTATATGNLVTNGTFANGMTGWNDWGNTWIGNGALNVNTSAGGAGQDISARLAAGARYRLSATANITSPGEGVFIGVKVMDAWGGQLLHEARIVNALTPTGMTLDFTAPNGAVSASVYIWKNAGGAVAVVDNVALTAL